MADNMTSQVTDLSSRDTLYIVDGDMYLNNTPQRIVAFPFQHRARKGAKMLR
jgi:hypothetical protein